MTASHNPGHETEGDIKNRESRLGATQSPRFPTPFGRPRRPTLPFWQLWTQFGPSPRRVAWRSLGAKSMGVFVGLPVDRMWNFGSDHQASVEIYHWGHLRFWLIFSSQNDPCLGPQFQPPAWSVGRPISPCPYGAGTQLQVVHLDMGPRSRLLLCGSLALPWPGEPPVGMTPSLVIWAS